jgi:Sel1 repeat
VKGRNAAAPRAASEYDPLHKDRRTNGRGVPRDETEAVTWLRKAAEAAKWSRKAAEQGHASAQYFLGYIYEKGQGVPRDYVACCLPQPKMHSAIARQVCEIL